MKRGIVAFFLCGMFTTRVYAQTCCTGGVPYLGAFKIPEVGIGQVGVSVSYVFNNNSDLVSQDNVISDNFSKRIVHTALAQIDYALPKHWSFSLAVPYLVQKEEVRRINQLYQISNPGMGDISIWSTYKLKFHKQFVALSFAIKVPTGKTDEQDPQNGINYPFSFQNGSGSWDMITNIYYELPLDKSRKLFLIQQLSAKYNSKGNNFGAHPGYRFGHTLQNFTALSYRWVMGEYLSGTFAGLAYQHKWQDIFDGGFVNENTGGDWINLNAGYQWQINPKFNTSISGGIPLFRKVQGLQLSTTFQFNLSVGFTI